jgi:hypothetical protein
MNWRIVRRDVQAGRFQRSMALITAFAAILSGFEAYVQHLRGAFSHWLMWTPVWLMPPTVLAAAAAVFSQRAARTLLPLLSLAALADGLTGFVCHVRGVQKLPGGFKLGRYNVVIGPPIFAPLLVCMVGLTGLLSGLLRRERFSFPWWSKTAFLAAWTAYQTPRRRALLASFEWRIAHGRFQQFMALTAAGFAVLAGGEAYFAHLRGSFNQRVMWTPIWVTPAMVLAGGGAALSERLARRVLPLVSTVAFLDGLLGFGLHLRGIKQMPGGFGNLQFNITLGPPIFAPLLFCAVGLLGFIASLLRRGR